MTTLLKNPFFGRFRIPENPISGTPNPSLTGSSRARSPHNDDVVVDDYDDGSKEEANTNTNHRNHFGRYVTNCCNCKEKASIPSTTTTQTLAVILLSSQKIPI